MRRYRVLNLGAGPIAVGDGTTDEALSAPYAVLDFWSPTCPPCLEFKPIFEEVATDASVSAVLAEVNADLSPDTVAKFQVTALPTTIFFANGQEVGRVEGKMSKEDLLANLKALFGQSAPSGATGSWGSTPGGTRMPGSSPLPLPSSSPSAPGTPPAAPGTPGGPAGAAAPLSPLAIGLIAAGGMFAAIGLFFAFQE
jgi:thioredoxin 1